MSRSPRSLSSGKNPIVQRFQAAARGESPELLLAEGVRLVREALAAGLEVVEAVVSPRLEDPALRDELARRAAQFAEASDAVLERVSALETPPGVAVLLRRPQWSEQDLLRGDLQPLLVLAAGVRDPGNVGALVRTAEAAGATGCLTLRGGADPFRDKAVRGSMGSVFRLPVQHGMDAAEALAFAERHRLRVVVADGAGQREHTEADLRTPTLLVVGAEAAGVPEALRAGADEHVRIRLKPTVESLNVAVAAGVLLFEAARQRS